ncbi:transcriptional regulator, LacI family [Catenulispora acidiphila DSM 44928]|uniref:Transcriptional regulator, LacI family n=1 Tax=Catenulispora acidiphila (strain DSM 44928 / JCM 14897 / NBRC 102108 / NRRL B-24433 / ID139908) TaxID=479433 RepID=C7PYZ7_CATAD|nr:LacI family DNA-binding transcriptional regulator [Catenulispora acidiphila]ACU69553.1 transcriptional regulator, LacI family [Catenulispora acidiphila DSM 44928]
MRVTIAHVALRAGVSKATVSRVLNGKGETDAATAARVRRVVKELGYVPSARAVSLAKGRTGVVGVLAPNLTRPWIAQVMQGVVDAMASSGHGLMLFTRNVGDDSFQRFAGHVNANAFDGLLVIEPEETVPAVAKMVSAALPVVLISDREAGMGMPVVATGNRPGGRQAAEHLLALGRRRPLVVGGPDGYDCAAERVGSFTAAFAEAGFPVPAHAFFPGDYSGESGRVAVSSAVADGTEFDAVFAHNDLSASGVLQMLGHLGRPVPVDVAVVGFDDAGHAALTAPPLTAVHRPLREIGAEAARMLAVALAGGAVPDEPVEIANDLVVRNSTIVPG